MGEASEPARPNSPRNLGLTLIALGTLTLIVAALQYQDVLRRLGLGLGEARGRMPVAIALALAVLGVVMFASVYFRTGPF